MNYTELILEKSPWLIVLCLLAGVFYALFLYFKENKFNSKVVYFLSFLRFTSVSILCFLLLVPLIKQIDSLIEKPTIVFAIDDSNSMKYHDSLSLKKIKIELQNIENSLVQKGYKVVKQFISGEEKNSKNHTETNLSSLLKNIDQNYTDRNLISTVLFTDGINNKGLSPQYLTLKNPVNVIGFGDTTFPFDAKIEQVLINKIAFKGNKYPITVEANFSKLKERQTTIQLSLNGKKVEEKKVNITKEKQLFTFQFLLDASKIGKNQITLSIPNFKNEKNTKNNTKDVYIDIIDGKQKILIAALAPNPDIKAIKKALGNKKNYDLEIYYASNQKKIKEKYDLVIYHQIPNTKKIGQGLLEKYKNTSNIYITGSQSDYASLNKIQNSIQFFIQGKQTDEVQVAFNKDNDKFNLDEKLITTFNDYPPMVVPFGDLKISKNTHSVFTQKIGSLKTDKPIMTISENNGIKTSFIIGEGLWKLRLAEYSQNQNFNAFDHLISKLIQVTAQKTDKRKLRVNPILSEYTVNDNAQISIEMYNDAFERLYEKEVSLTLKSNDFESKYKFINSEKVNKFTLGNLPKGVYQLNAQTRIGNKNEKASCSFVVSESNLEAQNTTANFNDLRKLANNNQGEFFTTTQLLKVENKFSQEVPPQKIISSFESLEELINQKWIFFLILFFVSLEWVTRKYLGTL